MPDTSAMPVFDGHNDVLLRLFRKGVEGVEQRDGDGAGHGPGLRAMVDPAMLALRRRPTEQPR